VTAPNPTKYRNILEIDPPLPHNPDAERSVLGAILLNNVVLGFVKLRPGDFFLTNHQRIFRQMIALADDQQPIDLVTLTDALHRHGDLEDAGGAPYVASLADGMPRVSNIEHYAEIVRSDALRRALIYATERIRDRAFESEGTPEDIAGYAVQTFAAITHQQSSPENQVEPSPILSEEAVSGLAGEMVRRLMPQTEGHPAAMLIEILMSFGNIVGRTVHYEVESTKHYGNIFAIKVGISSKSRKGTASKRISRIFEQVDPQWSEERIFSGLSSGEGLIWNVRDPRIRGNKLDDEGVVDQRMFVYEGEFASALAVMKREGNTLSPVIRNAWDSCKLRITVKKSPAASTNSHISILGDITQSELLRRLSESDRANGFANRFLWLHVERCGRKPFGGDEINFSDEVRRLKEAVEFAKRQGRVFLDRNAREMWNRHYERLSEGQPGLFGEVTSRAEAQVIRLALLYAMLDRSDHIRAEHLKAALSLWSYAEDSARYIFGGLSLPQRKILSFLQDGSRTRTEIYTYCFGKNRKAREIDSDIEALTKARLIVQARTDRGGVLVSLSN
jgi:hypothetical protein